MLNRDYTLEARIEALLFAAGHPLDTGEIAEILDEPLLEVDGALVGLKRTWDKRKASAIELIEGRKGRNIAFELRLKEEFRPLADKLLPEPLPEALLELLAVIAMNQPVRQSTLAKQYGSKLYEDVRNLVERGLIVRRKLSGGTYSLRTTERFAIEFGLENDPERIREVLSVRYQEN